MAGLFRWGAVTAGRGAVLCASTDRIHPSGFLRSVGASTTTQATQLQLHSRLSGWPRSSPFGGGAQPPCGGFWKSLWPRARDLRWVLLQRSTEKLKAFLSASAAFLSRRASATTAAPIQQMTSPSDLPSLLNVTPRNVNSPTWGRRTPPTQKVMPFASTLEWAQLSL